MAHETHLLFRLESFSNDSSRFDRGVSSACRDAYEPGMSRSGSSRGTKADCDLQSLDFSTDIYRDCGSKIDSNQMQQMQQMLVQVMTQLMRYLQLLEKSNGTSATGADSGLSFDQGSSIGDLNKASISIDRSMALNTGRQTISDKASTTTTGSGLSAEKVNIPTTGEAGLDSQVLLYRLNSQWKDPNVGFSYIGADVNSVNNMRSGLDAMEKYNPNNKNLTNDLYAFANKEIYPIAQTNYNKALSEEGTGNRYGLDGGSRWPSQLFSESVQEAQQRGLPLTVDVVGQIWKQRFQNENFSAS